MHRLGVLGVLVALAATASGQELRKVPPASQDAASQRARAPRFGPINIGTIPAGKRVKVVFLAAVSNSPTTNFVSNQGTVSGSNFPSVLTDDPDTPAPNDPTITPLDLQADLALSKSDGGATTTPGGTVAYTLSYSNLSQFGVPNVTLSDNVPANTTFSPGASTAGWTCTPNNNAGSVCTLIVGTVPGGAGGAATYAVTVVNPVPAGVTQISNTASVASTAPDPVPGNNAASDTTPVDAAPDLAITKSDGGATTTPGGTAAYALGYSNVGNQGATGVALADVVPADTTFNPGASTAGWTCTPNNNAGSVCSLNIGAVPASGSGAVTFAVTVVNPVPAGVTQISNTASVADDGTNGADPTPANNSASDTTPVNAAPDLAITKSDGGVSTTPGGTVTYTLSYSNAGNQGATGIVLTDVVPAQTTFNPGASTAGWVCTPDNNAGSACTLTVGALGGGGASGAATYAVTVVSPVPAGVAQISNTASVADDGTNGADPVPGNNSASDTTPVNAAPDLTITKSDGGVSTTPGGTVTYTLGYSNAGDQGATGVVLTDVVPANTTFNPGASTAGWTCTPNNNPGSACSLNLGGLNAGANGSAIYAVTVVNPVPAGVTQISNTASVTDDGSNGPDPTPANNSSTDTTPIVAAPDMQIAKSDGGISVAPGGTVVYTLDYANVGNKDATGVVLTDVVPANTTFSPGASSPGWGCTPDNNPGSSCTLALGLVGAGTNGSRAFAVTVANPVPAGVAQISNTASIADDGTNGTDPNPANNTSSDTTPLNAAPDLSITKSDGGASTTPGGTVSYTLSYSNVGNQGATGVALGETVPANTTFNPGASTAGWTCTPDNNPGSACTLTLGALGGGGASGSATYAVNVANPVPAGVAQISNTATVADDGTNGADPNPADNTATDTTPVNAAPDLSITKDDGGVSGVPGGTVAYALGYANGGDQDATGVALTETVPADTTFNPGASTAGWACTPDNNPGSTCTLALGALAVGASGSATFAVTIDDPVPLATTISNTASVADDGTNGADPTPADNTATDTTPVVNAPDLTLSKDDGGLVATPGQTIPYALGYANVGSRGATGVALNETVPANTTFNPGASTAGWICVPDNNPGSACTLAIGGVPRGSSGSAVFAADVAASVPGSVSQIANTATISDDGTNGADPNPGDNTASDTTPLRFAADVTVGELVHGSRLSQDLAALPGPLADEDLFRISQQPYSSYEVVVDGTTGDLGPVGPDLERLASDGSTVLQASVPAGTGPSRSLRWQNATASPVNGETVRVRSGTCTTACGPTTAYRIRAYDTTYAAARFNNAGTSISVLVVQNRSDVAVSGAAHFRDPAGSLILSLPISLPPKATFVLRTTTIPALVGRSGSLTVTHDGPYGALAGKATTYDPATSHTFDTPLVPRAR